MNERIKQIHLETMKQLKNDYLAELIVEDAAQTLEIINVIPFESSEDWDKGYNKALRTGSEVIKRRFGVNNENC